MQNAVCLYGLWYSRFFDTLWFRANSRFLLNYAVCANIVGIYIENRHSNMTTHHPQALSTYSRLYSLCLVCFYVCYFSLLVFLLYIITSQHFVCVNIDLPILIKCLIHFDSCSRNQNDKWCLLSTTKTIRVLCSDTPKSSEWSSSENHPKR